MLDRFSLRKLWPSRGMRFMSIVNAASTPKCAVSADMSNHTQHMARTILARTESMLMCSGLVIEQFDTSNEVKHCCIRDIHWSVMGLRVCVGACNCAYVQLCVYRKRRKRSWIKLQSASMAKTTMKQLVNPQISQLAQTRTHPLSLGSAWLFMCSSCRG